MEIIPAIDLKNGKCVRLYKGDFKKETIYSDDPVDTALKFQQDGAKTLHIVDLDGAEGKGKNNLEIIKKIAKMTSLKIQTGGGIKNEEQIKELLESGVKKVIIGSLIVKDPDLVKLWIKKFGWIKIVLAMDVRIIDDKPFVAVDGWNTDTNVNLFNIISDFSFTPLNILCTDIDRDGVLNSPNIELYIQILSRKYNISLQASGGVGSLSDIKNLNNENLPYVIVGKALYEKKFTLKEAILNAS